MNASLRPPVVLIKTKEAYSLWFSVLSSFPKIYRYNLGGKIENNFLSLLENTFITVYLSGERKSAQLSIAILKLDSLKFFLQLAWENKCLANIKYSALSEQLDEIGRMLGGWKKGLENKTPSNERRRN
ncbi:four helix bundle protein [Candidatus Falkowbacteria bacterium]|nr:four helix bundle protein [Candidatus Falkowbacteria bacterium]